jgi:hypothetical protein
MSVRSDWYLSALKECRVPHGRELAFDHDDPEVLNQPKILGVVFGER